MPTSNLDLIADMHLSITYSMMKCLTNFVSSYILRYSKLSTNCNNSHGTIYSYKQARPLAGLSALYLEYWLQSSPIFNIHHLSLPVIDYYLSLPACHRWKERALSRTICWKEQASSRSRRHVFHPDEFFTFTGHRSKYIRERAHAVSVTYAHTYTHTDTTNCKHRYSSTLQQLWAIDSAPFPSFFCTA